MIASSALLKSEEDETLSMRDDGFCHPIHSNQGSFKVVDPCSSQYLTKQTELGSMRMLSSQAASQFEFSHDMRSNISISTTNPTRDAVVNVVPGNPSLPLP